MKKILYGLLTAALVTAGIPLPDAAYASTDQQVLFINEVMASNTKTIRDGDIDDSKHGSLGGAYSDWIEIYNSSSKAIDLTGYTLTDSSATWKFPQGIVPAKGFLIVWASDKNKVAKDGQLHANFKISASGETITLKNADGEIVDVCTTISLKDDESYGRKTEGANQWVIFSKPTPLSANIYSAATTIVKSPVFSHEGGFYTSEFLLSITTDEPGVKIYYTKDGSDPIPGSESTYEYTEAINIKNRTKDQNVYSMIKNISTDVWNKWEEPVGELFKCTPIRAAAVREDGSKSKIITKSYFVDKNMMTRYKIPVISLVTDPANLFDDETGLYVNGNFEKKGAEWERPVHVEFFESDGTLAFSQNSGLRINGGYSRKVPQKPFRLYADHDYDDTNKYTYDVFQGTAKKVTGETLDSFKRLVLRNGGNDNGWTGVMFRDPLMQGLVSHLNLDTLAYRPCVVFLDGEFWGLYNIRERYDDEYFKSHYNVDKDKVVMLDVWNYPELQEGEPGDEKAYQRDIIDYLKTHSITDKDTYEYIKTKMDIENYITYNVAQIYYGNYDWPGNNVSIWRYKTDDGKYHPEAPYGQDGRWRWLLRDTDFGFGLYQTKGVSFDSIAFATGDVPEVGDYAYANAPWAVFLLKTLLNNSEFRTQFINTFADQINTSFEPTRVNKEIDKYKAGIEDVIQENGNRWRRLNAIPTYRGEVTWDMNIQAIRNYVNIRPTYVRRHIINKFKDFGVTGTADISLSTNTSQGYVRINSIDIKSTTPGITDPANWTGVYFLGVPVILKAIPEKGYRFDHWEGVEGVTNTSDTITFTPDGNMNVKAVFKPENEGYKLSGYISPDFDSDYEDFKTGFKVEVIGTGLSASTDSKGYFEIGDIPQNSEGYKIKISKPNYIYRQIDNVVISGNTSISTQSNPIHLWGGDINGDNVLNMSDVIEIAKAFNSVKGDNTYISVSDVNMDNAINMMDMIVIAKHFNATPDSYKNQ